MDTRYLRDSDMQRDIYGPAPSAPPARTKRCSRDAVPTYWIDVDLEEPPPVYSRKKSDTTPHIINYLEMDMDMDMETENGEAAPNRCKSCAVGTITCTVGLVTCAFLLILLIIALIFIFELTRGKEGTVKTLVKFVYYMCRGRK